MTKDQSRPEPAVRYDQHGAMEGCDVYRVDISADLNDEDQTGRLWTFLD